MTEEKERYQSLQSLIFLGFSGSTIDCRANSFKNFFNGSSKTAGKRNWLIDQTTFLPRLFFKLYSEEFFSGKFNKFKILNFMVGNELIAKPTPQGVPIPVDP